MKNYSYKNFIFVSDDVQKHPLGNQLRSGNKSDKLWVETCSAENKTVVTKNLKFLRPIQT